MKRIIFSLTILMIVYSFAIGQETIDVIYLKNGDMVKGIIIENALDNYIKIELEGGTILTYNYDDIDSFSQETKDVPSPPATQWLMPTDPYSNPNSQSQNMSDRNKNRFSKGTISAGSLFNFSSYTSHTDDNNPTMTTRVGNSLNTSLRIKPIISYFVHPSLSIDVILGYKLTVVEGENDENRQFSYGGGVTFYIWNVYAGAGMMQENENGKFLSYSKSSGYLEFHGGYLHELAENVFLDLGVSSLLGIGEVIIEPKSGDRPILSDNTQAMFHVNMGIKAFFNN